MSELPTNNLASPYALIPELGDLVTFVSDVYKSTTGRIIYRDGTLIRVRPFNSSSSAIDFPLDPVTGEFRESLGVTQILIHEKRRYPHFSKQLSVRPGEILEFFDTSGQPIVEFGIVYEVIATEEYDAIKLENGTVLDFGFIGPQPPIAVIRPRAPVDEELNPENESTSAVEEEEEEAFPDIDFDMLPVALVEEIPTEERTYSDSLQREDMFISLLVDIALKRQKDPKVMQRIYRETDLLLALKNSIVTRDESGAVVPGAASRSYIANTIATALAAQPNGAPIAALLPVAAVKKVLYTDDTVGGDHSDVEVRSDIDTLKNVSQADELYAKSNTGGNPYITYLNTLLKAVESYVPAKEGDAKISVDQDVLRSQIPPTPVEGFPSVPPAFNKKKEAQELTIDSLGTVTGRGIRLLSASRIRNPKTGTVFTVAPADTAETVGHVLLSKEMARFREPTRSAVLLWDVQASERSRKSTGLFYNTLMRRWDAQKVIVGEEDVFLVDALNERLMPSLNYINRETVPILDSLGLRNLELSEEIMAPLLLSVEAGQAVWNTAYAGLRKHALESFALPAFPPVSPVTSAESPLLSDTTLGHIAIKGAVADFLSKENLLKKYDIALANDLLGAADATLGPLWYALANGVATPPEILSNLEMTYRAQAVREERNTLTHRELSKAFTASPIINPCKHVHELEKVKSIKNDQARMLIFDKFLKDYQAGQQGNWILCGTCGKDLVCKHEVLMLNESMNPGRGQSLHKALLLEYAGPVFEGSYICKTCGQKIQDIEYDTHLEFDDEGRPLVGSNIVEQEQSEEQEVMAIREEAEQEIPFKGKDRSIYNNLRTVFERCGAALPISYYERAVVAVKTYIERNIKSPDQYDDLQKKLKAAKRPEGPRYDGYYANSVMSVIGAIVVLELQTSSVPIPIPHSGCTLSRDGFPLDGPDPSTAGTGALSYVACVLAHVKNNYSPWNETSWSPETKMESRIKTVELLIRSALYSVLSLPLPNGAIPPPLEGVTDTYRTMLEEARDAKVLSGTSAAALASFSDKLPSNFRPLPRMSPPSVIEETPIGNRERFMANVKTGDIETILPIVMERQNQLTQQVIADFHIASSESGVIIPGNPRSDSTCCFARLGAISLRGFGTQSLSISDARLAEIAVHNDATQRLVRRDPAMPAAGTHVYVPWSAPYTTVIVPEADPSVYYKLFLKNCFRGRNYGLVHEFGSNHVCRNCRFALPSALAYMTFSEISDENAKKREKAMEDMLKKREEIALEAFHAQGVVIDENTFRDLEERIRSRKMISAAVPIVSMGFIARLQSMSDSLSVLLPVVKADWQELVQAMELVQAGSLVDLKRARALSGFADRYKQRSADLRGKMMSVLGKTKEDTVRKALESLDRITEDAIGSVSVRNLANLFVVNMEQVAQKNLNIKPRSTKWFPKINRSHKELLDSIWEKLAASQSAGVRGLSDLENEDVASAVTKALDAFSTWLGPWLHIWRDEFRPNAGFTEEEYTIVLRWSIYTGLLSLCTHTSTFYADAPSSAVAQEAVTYILSWILGALDVSGKLVTKYQLTGQQVRDQIVVREEMERASFIKRLDDKDKEMRKIELIKKGFKMGDWNIGNMSKYSNDMFEFMRAQREAMGVPEFSADIVDRGAQQGAPGEEYGFHTFGQTAAPDMYDNDHRATQDEDV